MRPWLPALIVISLLCSAPPAEALGDGLAEDLPFQSRADQTIHTVTFEPPEDVPVRGTVLFTHGFTDNSRNHFRLYETLIRERFRVVAHDMIGHGTSFGERGYVEDFSLLVSALRQVHLRIQERYGAGHPVYLAGYSMGALVTLRYAAEADAAIAGSFYVSPLIKMKMGPFRKVMAALSGLADHLMPRFATSHGVTVPMLTQDPAVLAAREKDPYFFRKISVRLFRQLLKAGREVAGDAPRIRKPVLFMVAGDEYIVEPQASLSFYGSLPGPKECQVFPDQRHELDNERRSPQVLGLVTRWLKEQDRRAAFRAIHGSP